jgi:hypothetical protein
MVKMERNQKWIKLQLQLQKGVKAEILITDNVAIMKFDKKGLAKQNYEAEKKEGNGRAEYDLARDIYIEKYTGWTCEMISEKILKECKDAVVSTEKGNS